MLLKKCDGVPFAGLTAQLGLDVLFLSAQTAGIVELTQSVALGTIKSATCNAGVKPAMKKREHESITRICSLL